MARAVQVYGLCRPCVERHGGRVGDSPPVGGADCFICEGLMDRTSQITKEVARRIKRYQFDSLAVGVSMPEGVQDREDELRANLKLKGSETIKTHAARLIAESVASKLGKRVDKTRPDLTVVVDMGSGVVTVSSKALFLYGWYTKPPGVSQKRELCGYCSGQGCEKCRATGYNQGPSVEGQLRIKLAKVSGSDRMKFTWMGNEDRESRVYPPGRPFVVELKSPVKRQVPMEFRVRSKEGPVSVSKGKMLPSRPIGLPAFRFKTEITAIAAKEVEAENLAEACRRFKRAVVRFDRPHERPVQKMVYGVQMKKRGKTLLINAELDGGLPVKRFVSGELVSPSVSEILKTEVRCRKFDIREVKEMGKLEFGKVTRL